MQIKSAKDVASSGFIALVVGESGIGKTSLVKTLPNPENTLIVSAESGLLCIAGSDIDVVEVRNYEQLREAILFLIEGKDDFKYENIYIDSLTEMATIVLDHAKSEYPNDNQTLRMYGHYNELMTKIIKTFRDLPDRNVIFTCLNALKTDGLETVETFLLDGSKIKDNLKGWFDLVLKYDIMEHEGTKHRVLITDTEINHLAKDRSGKLDKYEKPDLASIMEKIGVTNG